jgi:hypothetical protein
MGSRQAFGIERRHHMGPQRGAAERVHREAGREQPERAFAKRVVQVRLGASRRLQAGRDDGRPSQRPGMQRRHADQQHRADDGQRRPPAQRILQHRHRRKAQGAGETAHQRQRCYALRVALRVALGQHVEGRLVQCQGHRCTQDDPGDIEHPRLMHLRPHPEPHAGERGASCHDPPPEPAVDGSPGGIGRGTPDGQAKREGAHQGGLAPAQRLLHRQHERREGVVEGRPAQQLPDRHGRHGGAKSRACGAQTDGLHLPDALLRRRMGHTGVGSAAGVMTGDDYGRRRPRPTP